MSWIFGIIGSSLPADAIERCTPIHSAPLGTFQQEGKYYIAAGGFPSTCLKSSVPASSASDSFCITLGCAFSISGSKYRQLTADDWSDIVRQPEKVNALEGHFLNLFYDHNQFVIRNDRLGLRTLYWYETSTEVIISSRIDWLAKYCKGLPIDFAAIGSRWLLFNPLTYDAPVEGVKKLGPAGNLSITPDRVHYHYARFSPKMSDDLRPRHFIDKLECMVAPQLSSPLHISLGLSGGLDSRVLLSSLLSSGKNSIATHTFGNLNDPDVMIPHAISAREGFPHRIFHSPMTDGPSIELLLNDYVCQTNLIEPISTVLRLHQYSGFDKDKFLLMDGGFGEVARRQYLNRIAINGKRDIELKSVDNIYHALQAQRGDLFGDDIVQTMVAGAKQEINRMLETMPPLSSIGMGNYLDLWAVRTRLPNYGCDEQARLDSTILNYMPFAQPGFIEDVFNLPIAYRNNGALFRKIISSVYPPLKKYPLVKNGTTYPFNLPTIGSWLWTKAKIQLGTQYRDESVHIFLFHVKEYVMDLLRSRETIEYAPYDYSKIEKNILEYYRGNKPLFKEVNWWLSFELWKRNIMQAQ